MSACLLRALIISLTFSLCFSNPIQGKHDASLDPNRIQWWRTRWSPLPIELSSINAEALGVSVTLRWSPSTDIPSGIIELEFPREFYTPGGGNLILTSSITNIKSGQDYTTKFSTLVDNPASGVYGPIKVRTRYFTTGQIIDVNENFAVLAIAPKEKAENSNLLVSLESTPRVGDLNKELRVSFNLLQSIFKYDIVTIGVDTRWVLSDTVECSSYKDPGATRYFNGVDEKDKSKIACSVEKIEERQYIQVYGLGNDIDISDQGANGIELRFKYVSVPRAKYESYDWSLKISRFGTRWAYQSARYTQGPQVQTGSIISGSWKPTWNYIDRSAISVGMSLYIDISIPTLNTIPVGGSMTIVLTSKVNPDKYYGNTANGCWVVSPSIKGMICTADKNTNTLTIRGFEEEIKPRTIVVSTVIDFTATSFGIKIVSTYSGYLQYLIDSGADIDIAILSSSSLILETFLDYIPSSYITQSTSYEAGFMLVGGRRLALVYNFASNPLGTREYTHRFYLPYTLTTEEDNRNKFYISSKEKLHRISNYNNYKNYISSSTSTTIDSSLIKYTIESDMSYIEYNYTVGSPSSNKSYALTIAMSDSNETILFPTIASNASNRYMIVLELKRTTNPAATYYANYMLNLKPKSLTSYTYSTTINKAIMGRLGIISITSPFDYPSPSSESRDYYLEIAFPSDSSKSGALYDPYLGTDLKDGDPYPVTCSNLGSECSSTIWYDGFYTYLRFRNPIIRASTSTTVNFTYGSSPSSSSKPPIYARLYCNLSSDSSSLKHIFYENIMYPTSNYYYYNPKSTIDSDIYVSTESIILNGPSEYTRNLFLTVYGEYSFSNSTKILQISTMQEIALSKIVYTVAGRWSMLYCSSNDSFLTEIVIEGMSLPKYSDKRGTTLYMHYTYEDSVDEYTYRLYPNIGDLANVRVMPKSLKARGYSFALTDITVSFTTSNQIPSGGQIVIQINDKWEVSSVSTECKITGLEPLEGKTLNCSISNNLYTISNLNSVKEYTEISITIRKLITPTYSDNPISLFNSITTYADSSLSYEIDYFDATKSTDDDITLTTNSDPAGSAVVNYLFNLPSNLNTDSTSIFMTVGLASSIPAGSIFLITFNNLEWLYPNGDIKNFCWVRGFKYQKCEKAPGGISITLAEDLYASSNIDIYLENCIRTPSYSSAIENAIQFTVSYSSYTIISNSQGYSYNPTIIPKTISATVSLSVKTFGEASNYTFSIVSSKVISSGDEIWILFPGDYDFFIGDVSASSDNTVFTITCEGNNAECVVDHRIVIIRGITTTKANEAVSVSLINVYNPNVLITGNIVIAHYDTVARVFKGIGMISGESINKTSPSNLVITKIDITDRTLENPADYEIWFEFLGTFDENTVIYVRFPQEFEINEGSNYSCTLNLKGDSAIVLANTSCSYKYSLFFFQLTKSQSRSFSVATLLSLKISSVTNNLKPLPRSEPISDWERDLTDSTTFSKYELYSSRFTLYILSKSSNTIVSKSYYEMNPSYLGYNTLQPEAKLTASASASVCEDLYIDGSLSIGNDLAYSWEVISDIPNSALAQFNSSLKSGHSSSSLVIPASVLKPSVITVYLTVSSNSYSNSKTNYNYISIEVSEFEPPALEFITGDIATTSYSTDYTIRISVKLPKCSSLSTDHQYEWSISPTSSKFSSPNKPQNTVPKGSLLPGAYTITVTFSIPSIPNYTYSASMELTVQSSELVVIITGGNRKHNISKELILDGSSSYDPDGLATSLLYFWQCSYQNTPCKLSDSVEYYKSSFRIPPFNFEDSRVYIITLTVRSSLRESNTSTVITATNDDLPDIYIHPPSAEFIHTVQNTLKLYIPEGIKLTSMKWSCNINSVIFSESPDFTTIYIKEFTLQGGTIQIFTFTAEYKGYKILSTMDVYVDAPPSPGEFIISPKSGTSLTTLFSFLAQNWTDKENDLPLRYELYRVMEYGALRIGVLNGNRELNTVLPAGNPDDDYDVEFILRVYDSLGAYTEKLSKVKVQPSNDIYGEAGDYIENMMNDKNYEESRDILINLKYIADSLNSDKNLDIEKTQDIVSKAMDLLTNYYQTHDLTPELSLIYTTIASLTSLHTDATVEIVDETVDIIYDILYQAPTTDVNSLTNIINIMNNLQSSIIPSLSSSNFNLTSYRIHECIQLAGQSFLSNNVNNTYLQELSTDSLYIQVNRVPLEEFSSSISIKAPSASIILPSISNKIQDVLLISSPEAIDYIVSQTKHKIFSNSSDESLVGYISLDLYVPGSDTNGKGRYMPSRRINVQNLTESIKISLPLNHESDSDEFVCVYLIEDTQKWSTRGCRFVEKVDNYRVICECNHLSLFSAIGNKERISLEEYNEIPTVEDDDIEANEEEDDEMSFSIIILIGALVFIHMLLSISGIYIDDKQASEKFKLANLSKFPLEEVKYSIQPTLSINSNPAQVSDQLSPNLGNDLYSLPQDNEGIPVDPQVVLADIVIERVQDDSPEIKEPEPQEFILYPFLNFSISPEQVIKKLNDSLTVKATSVQNLKNKDKSCLEWIALEHEFLGFFMRYDEECSKLLRVLVFFTGNYLGIFILGLLYNRNLDADNERESKSALDILKEFDYVDALYILVAICVGILCFFLRIMVTNNDKKDVSVYKVIGVISSWIIGMGSIAGSVIFSLEYHVIYIQRNVTIMWSYSAAIFFLIRVLIIDFISYPISLVFDGLAPRRTLIEDLPQTSRA